MSDPYRVLGVPTGATPEEVRSAYFSQVRAHPPEKEPELFKAIRAAYEQLSAADRGEDLFRLREPARWRADHLVAVIDEELRREDILLALEDWGDLMPQGFTDDFVEVTL